MQNKKKIIVAGLVTLIVVMFVMVHSCKKTRATYNFETTKIIRGTINNSVTATGTIQAIKTVAVGTQVSGVIKKLYADFNSNVKKGELLAELDKTPLLAALDNAQASLESAKASLTYQTANYNRLKSLHDKKLVAESDYDQALYNFVNSQTQCTMANSNFEKAKIDLNYASIYSPIDGVVLNRAVDEGQTVAASFSTPTLFSIANDLTQMEVAANIDEADIGQVKIGQKVEFTVDAFPDLKFTGEVIQIRLQPTTTSNVVTYTVIVKAPNEEKKLMPGMTANITIIIEKSNNVLISTSKALRFDPDTNMINDYRRSLISKENPHGPLDPTNLKQTVMPVKQLPETVFPQASRVWVKSGDVLTQKIVVTGITDGINTEIKSGVNEGDEVIISMSPSLNAKSGPQSPFMPPRPGGKK